MLLIIKIGARTMRSSVHLSLDVEVLEKFNELSHKANKSRNKIMSELVLQWMEDYEDYELAEEALKELEEGKDTIISHEEFKRELAKLDND